MPFPWLAAATLGTSLLGGLFGTRQQQPYPTYQPYQSPFASQLDADVRRLMSGQLSPAEREIFARRREEGMKFLRQQTARTPSGGFARNVGRLESDLALAQTRQIDANRQRGQQLAQLLESMRAGQYGQQYQAQLGQWQAGEEQRQQQLGMWGGIGARGLQALFAPQGATGVSGGWTPTSSVGGGGIFGLQTGSSSDPYNLGNPNLIASINRTLGG